MSKSQNRQLLPTFLASLALAWLAVGTANTTRAITTTWTHTTTGTVSWFDATNWAPAVPVPGDAAIVNNTTAFVEGSTAATAGTLSIASGGVTIGDFNAGTLNVDSLVSVTGGRLSVNFGTVSLNTLEVGTAGTYADTKLGTLAFTGLNPTIRLASVNVVVNGQITGANGLNETGPGTLVLANANAYTGGTTISTASTLQVGNGGTTGALGAGNVTNNGILIFNRGDNLTVSNPISGPGSVRQSGAGTLTLTGNNTHTGDTLISAGVLQIGDGGTTGTLGTGTTTDNARLVFNRSDNLSVGSVIGGTGNLTQAGTGSVILTANNTYSGTTTISSGTLQVGNGGITGALGTGAVTNNGNLVFNRSDAIVIVAPISGTGSLQQAGAGTLTLTGSNIYSGGTTISSGTVQIGNGGTTGSLGTGTTTNNGRLIFNRSDSLSFDGVIVGTGSVRHSGSGTLTLTAINTYTGGTWIDGGGTLRVINSSGLGNGDLNLTNGTLKADATSLTSRTTVTIGGNYNQSAGTTLELGVGGTAANSSDQVKAAGKAVVSGNLQLDALGSYRPLHNTQLVLVSASGGVTGRFTTLANNFTYSPLLTPQLVYNPNDVTLAWAHGSFQPYAVTNNQKAVAGALDSIVTSNATGDVQLIDHLDYDYLANLKNGLRGALDQISPVGLTATLGTSFAGLDLQGDQFLKRADELRAGYPAIYRDALRSSAASTAAFDDYVNNPWSVYLGLPYNSVTVKGDSEASGYDLTTRGVTLGLDRHVNERVFVGVSGSYLNSKADAPDGGQVDTTSFAFDAYAGWSKNGFHLVGLAGGSSDSFDTKRTSLGGVASGSTKGFGWTGLVGGGYDWQKGSWVVGSDVALQYQSAGIDKFTETGSLAPLHLLSQTADAWHSQWGVKLRYQHLLKPWVIVTPNCYVGWRHDFQDERLSLDSQSASGSGSVFTVRGTKLGTESFIGSVGLSIQWRPAVNTYLNFTQGVGRSGYDSKNVQLVANLSF